VLDAIADAFVVIDTEFRSTYLNEHAAELLGKPIKSLVGRPLWDTFAGRKIRSSAVCSATP
jgi:PAS domain S-box-containing protein